MPGQMHCPLTLHQVVVLSDLFRRASTFDVSETGHQNTLRERADVGLRKPKTHQSVSDFPSRNISDLQYQTILLDKEDPLDSDGGVRRNDVVCRLQMPDE